MLQFCPGEICLIILNQYINSTEQTEKQVTDTEDKEILVKFGPKLHKDKDHTHCKKEGTYNFECKEDHYIPSPGEKRTQRYTWVTDKYCDIIYRLEIVIL